MILQLMFGALLVFITPPTIDPATLGDRDPIAFEYPNNGTLSCQPFTETLTRNELAQAIANLPISTEIRNVLVACAREKYPSYLTARDDVVKRRAEHYIGMCALHSAHRDATEEFPTLEQARERDRLADVVRRELKQAEQDFIDALGTCLDDSLNASQVEIDRANDKNKLGVIVLESLSLKAQRRNTELSYHPRGDSLELRDMVNRLNLDKPIRINVEPELLDYERSIAALKPAQCKAYWGIGLRTDLLGKSAAPDAEIKIINISGRIGIQIRIVALASAARLAQMLPEKEKQIFERELYRCIFPELANDKDGEALGNDFSTALNAADLSKEDAQRIQSLQQSWQLELAAWRMNTEASLLEWWDQRAFGFGQFSTRRIEPMRDELLVKRTQLHDHWRMILADQLPKPVTP